MELFVSADNIFDVQYSLGNDINAFGARFYNAAPAFNMAGGISLHFNFR
jgi:iron complex outermembrane receptor protein